MRKLKLPRHTRIPAGLLPPALAPAAPPPPSPGPEAPSVVLLLGRREFLKALGVLAAAAMLPLTHVERAWAAARGRFFTRHERATLRALVDRIIPPDRDPGAAALGAEDYIEGLLTALDRHRPFVFAGGPFSNRNPFPDNTDGTPSHHRPHDSFRRFLPLTRLQTLYWRAQLFRSAGSATSTARGSRSSTPPRARAPGRTSSTYRRRPRTPFSTPSTPQRPATRAGGSRSSTCSSCTRSKAASGRPSTAATGAGGAGS